MSDRGGRAEVLGGGGQGRGDGREPGGVATVWTGVVLEASWVI